MIDKGSWDKECIWNPNNCNCEFDKSCDIGEYLDYKNCKCREKLIDKLVEECSENCDGNEMINNKTLNDYKNVYNPCTIYTALFETASLIIINISRAFIFFHRYLKGTYTETTIY